MSRSDGSAFSPYPSDADHHSINRLFHRESDELPDAPELADYEEALWSLHAGEVIQSHCMCGKWSSVGQCEDCQRSLAEMERDCADEERRRRDRAAWKKFPRSAA